MKYVGIVSFMTAFSALLASIMAQFAPGLLISIAAVLASLAHPVCSVIHRRHLAVRGELRDLPLSRLGLSEQAVMYRSSLGNPLVDLALYLALFGFGFFACFFWYPFVVILPAVYAATIAANMKVARRASAGRASRRTMAWMLLMIFQPVTSVPALIPQVRAIPSDSLVWLGLALAFWAAFFVVLALLLFLHLPDAARGSSSDS